MTNSLHIVCLDAPSPPNYGGAIDMYYKIEALAATGTKIILHYFDYKKTRNCLGLEHICQEVHSYKRNGNLLEHLKRTPYIISSRINDDLIKRLNQDDFPVLFEGLHTTGIVPYLKNTRRILVRMHNNEGTYYRQLAKAEANFFRKSYYKLESIKIDRYQNRLDKNIPLACISAEDEREFNSKGFTKTFHLPAFIPYSNVSIEGKTGNFCLYHGNLSIAENTRVVQWLINHVFSSITIPFIIAGRNIPPQIISSVKPLRHISLVNNPTKEEMDELVKTAQVHVLPSFNSTGVKLKLLDALLRGRHCIVNQQGVEGSGLDPYCHIANTASEFINTIKQLAQKPLAQDEIAKRKEILATYDNAKNARQINAYLL